MSFASYAFGGLVMGTTRNFLHVIEKVELADTSAGDETGAQTGSFEYDDTGFGGVTAGILATLGSNSGQLVQLLWNPVGFSVSSTFNAAGTLNSLAFSMSGGPGALDACDVNASNSAGAIVTVADRVPYTPPFVNGPVMLLRPTVIDPVTFAFAGRDDSNAAMRTLWLPDEIGVVTADFEVDTGTFVIELVYATQGWNLP